MARVLLLMPPDAAMNSITWRAPSWIIVPLRALLVALATLGVVLVGAGAMTALAERRLAALAPGGVEFRRLHYRPFAGRLSLEDVRARDVRGRVVFVAPRVTGRVDMWGVITGHVRLRALEVASPRLVITSPPASDLLDLAAQGATRPLLAEPLTVEGLMVTDGALLVEAEGQRNAPFVARGIDVRLDRLEAASPRGWNDAAFIVQMVAYGATIQVAGRPIAGRRDYVMHVTGRGVDLPGWLRDFPIDGVTASPGARGEIDASVSVTGDGAMVSGLVRGGPVTIELGAAGQLHAKTVHMVLEAFDLGERTGRLARLHLQSPSLTLVADRGGRFAFDAPDLVRHLAGATIRRLSVSHGEIRLATAAGLLAGRLVDVDLDMEARSSSQARDLAVTATARVGDEARMSVRGIVRPEEPRFDGVLHLAGLPLTALTTPLISAVRAANGSLTFDGHLILSRVEGTLEALLSGQASLAAARLTWEAPVPRDFSADQVTVAVRRYEWPRGITVIDSLAVTRPLGSMAPAPASVTTVDGTGLTVTGGLDGLLAAVEAASRPLNQGDAGEGAASVRTIAEP